MSETLNGISILLLGIAITLLLSPNQWRAWYYNRQYGKKPKPDDLIQIGFINRRGENSFFKEDNPDLNVGTNSWFKINLHFNIRAIDQVNITSIRFDYISVKNKRLSLIDIKKNGESVELDGHFDILNPIKLEVETVVNMLLLASFKCKADECWESDYGYFSMVIGLTTRRANGFKDYRLKGKLNPGGEAVIESIDINCQ